MEKKIGVGLRYRPTHVVRGPCNLYLFEDVTMSSVADTPISTDTSYSRPEGGLFCLLDRNGRLAVNANGQACCFDSEESAQVFLSQNPDLAAQMDVQEVFVKGEVHGWEQVPAEQVDERSLEKTSSETDS